MNNKVQQHFDSVASRYIDQRKRGLLGFVVRAEERTLLSLLHPTKKDVILDAGCGSGYYLELLQRYGARVFGVDISSSMVASAKRHGFSAQVADLENLDLSRQFNKILCAGVLEFCHHPYLVLHSLQKNMKKKGTVVFLIPRLSAFGILYYLYHRLHGVHIHLFSLSRFRTLLRVGGFEMVTVQRADPLFCFYAVLARKS